MNFAHAEVATLDPTTMRTLCEEYIANNYIDPETSERLGVKRGLRNPDGTGVLAGLTNVCDVVGYKKDQEGHVIPIPGRLIYRGVDINEIVNEAYRNDRFVFEEVIWLLLFGSLPVTYYIFDYATTIYSDALYSGIQALNEFLPTVLITFYVLFLPAFHLQSQRRADAEMQRSMLEAELEQSQSEMDSLHRLETQTAVYQHDMRHHLNMLDGLLSVGRPDEAAAYIKKVQADIEAITPRRFCENHLVNLLCSSFTDKAQRQGTVLTVDASLPNDVAISDTELCSLLSNGLENALHAVADLPADRKQISLYCGVRQNKLLIEIRNPCAGPIAMRDGLPISDREGHGYGCRSIQAIAQRNGGLCVFSAQQGQFLLQIMLPVLET